MLNIPYSRAELTIAMLRLREPEDFEEKLAEINQEIKSQVPTEKEEVFRVVAEHNGITVNELINSPDYKTLCEKYLEHLGTLLVEKIKEKFSLTDVEAWAVFAVGMGAI